MAKSKRTKKCKNMTCLFSVLHLLCLFGPLLYFIPYGYITGETISKVAMSFTVIVSVILAMISLLVEAASKQGLQRCIMWILIAGVLFCLKEVQVFIWIMACTSIVDEIVFIPLKRHYQACLIANKEIDRRG